MESQNFIRFKAVFAVVNEAVADWFEENEGEKKFFVGSMEVSFPETASAEHVAEVLRREFQRDILAETDFTPMIRAIREYDLHTEDLEANCVVYVLRCVDYDPLPICANSFQFRAPRHHTDDEIAKDMAEEFHGAFGELDLVSYVNEVRDVIG